MKNILTYLKDIFKVLIWPIIFIIGQFLLIAIFGVVFNVSKYNELKVINDGIDNSEFNVLFNNYINSNIYQNDLQSFIKSNAVIISVITFVIFCCLFYKKYKKYNIDYRNKINYKQICFLLIFGVCLNIGFNLIMSGFNNVIHFTDNYNNVNNNLFVYLICTGFLGPILEEFLFRGIVYNKLKKFNKIMKSIILTSLIFAFFHQNMVQVIYAFCLSFVLIYVYEKYKTLKAPIVVHIVSNIINYFVCILITQNIVLLNTILLVSSIGILFLIRIKIIKYDLKK